MIVRADELRFAELPGRRSADPFGDAAQDEGVSVRIVRLRRTAGRVPHRHPRSCEVIYVVHGRGVFWEDGRVEGVREGDCVLVARGAAHATIPDEGEDMLLACFFPEGDLASNTEELKQPIDTSTLPGGD